MLRQKLLFFFILFCITLNAQQLKKTQQTFNRPNKNFFIPNLGQWDPGIKYLARVGGMNAWVTNEGVVYDYYKLKADADKAKIQGMTSQEVLEYELKNTTVYGHIVKMQLINSEKDFTAEGNNRCEGYYNYFIGSDENRWALNVPLYDYIELKGVYKNINIKYYYDEGKLRYDLIVQPGADLEKIKFMLVGQDGISFNSAEELVLATSIGEVTNGKLYAYQTDEGKRKEIECRFIQREDGTIGFKAEGYDKKKELIIDPLVFSTFIGGNVEDMCSSIALDSDGNAYITGYTFSPQYPITSGAYQTINNYSDAFVTKLNPTGSSLAFSTFIGGDNSASGHSIALDSAGNAYITGGTNSTNFPVTKGAFQTILRGNGDIIAFKLNSKGNSLLYSTYIGGELSEAGNSIAVDAKGCAYITGTTYSSNYPVTSEAFQKAFKGGGSDVFFTKLNPTGSDLAYSTFLGGYNSDFGHSIAIDKNRNVYVTGRTESSNFPVTPGSYQTVYTKNAMYCPFITKLNPAENGLVFSTFVGQGYGLAIAVDTGGNSYITGNTYSQLFPVTPGAYKTTYNGGYSDCFVTKLNAAGSNLAYSTFLGGSDNDEGSAIAIDQAGNAFITGITISSNFPTTREAYQPAINGNNDLFITKLNTSGSTLGYSTYIGGNNSEFVSNIALAPGGKVYIAGTTRSFNYPVTNGAYQPDFGGYYDAFVSKFAIPQTLLVLNSPVGGEVWQGNTTHTISWSDGGYSPGNIKIDISTDNGTSWVNLTTVSPANGGYSFAVPPLNSYKCRVMVSIVGWPEFTAASLNNFTITTSEAPSISLLSPSGLHSYRPGSIQNIKWVATNNIKNVNISLSTDMGLTWNIVARSLVAQTGSYNWAVPAMPSVNCLLKLANDADSTVYALSDTCFAIKSLNHISPQNGEIWEAGAKQSIVWSSTGVQNVDILFSSDNGKSWSTVINSFPAAGGAYKWIAPTLFSSDCLIKIIDTNDSLVTSYSSQAFIIWQPVINNITPILGQTTVKFIGGNMSLDIFVFTATAITDTFFAYKAPLTLASHDSMTVSNYYWALSAPGISFINGHIKIPLTSLNGAANLSSLIWLKRKSQNERWQNIGSVISNGYLISTVPFDSFGCASNKLMIM